MTKIKKSKLGKPKKMLEPLPPPPVAEVVGYVQDVDRREMWGKLRFTRHDGTVGERLLPRGELRLPSRVQEVLDPEGVNYDKSDLKRIVDAHSIDSSKVEYGYSDVGWRPSGQFGGPGRTLREGGHDLTLMPIDDNSVLAAFLDHAGDLDAWNKSVGAALSASSFAIFAVGVAFAAPLLRFSTATEGATFAFSGDEGVGKTSCCMAAQAVMGTTERHLLTSWDGSPVGLKDVLGETSETAVLIDDTSRDSLPATERLRFWTTIGHAIAGGGKRHLARSFQATQGATPHRRPALALTSGEIAPDELAKLTGAKLMGGARVRFIDIPVSPKDEGGAFDLAVKDVPSAHIEETGAAAADRLHAAITETYGVAFSPYLDHLERCFAKLPRRVRRIEAGFVKRAKKARKRKTGASNQRLIRKFGLVFAGLKLAIEAKVLALTKRQAVKAVEVCLEAALRRQDIATAERRRQVRALRGVLRDAHKVPRLERGQALSAYSVGFRRMLNGAEIAYMQAEKIGEVLELDEAAVGELIGHLATRGALLPGTGADRTRPAKVAGKQSRYYGFRVSFFRKSKKGKPETRATPPDDEPTTSKNKAAKSSRRATPRRAKSNAGKR